MKDIKDVRLSQIYNQEDLEERLNDGDYSDQDVLDLHADYRMVLEELGVLKGRTPSFKRKKRKN